MRGSVTSPRKIPTAVIRALMAVLAALFIWRALPLLVVATLTGLDTVDHNFFFSPSVSTLQSGNMTGYGNEMTRRDSISIHPFLFSPSTSMQPVTIIMRGYKFRIPRNYILSLDMDGDVASLQLLTRTPDFAGYDEYAKSRYDTYDKNFAKREVVINTMGEVGSVARGNQRFLSDALSRPDPSDRNGLVRLEKSDLSAGFDVFVSFGKDYKSDVIIECFKQKGSSPPTCESEADTPQKIIIMYEFDNSQLPDWKNIREQVLKLFNGFCVGEAK